MKLQDLAKYSQDDPLDKKDEKPRQNENGVTIRDITFSNSVSGRVSAYLVIPTGTGPFPTIHFIHWLETHDHFCTDVY